jgi:hypothetical protein
MKHLIEDEEGKKTLGRRMIACQFDDGKFARRHAFSMLDGDEIYIISPCNKCMASLFWTMNNMGSVRSILEMRDGRSIVYRGFWLTPEDGYNLPEEGTDGYKGILSQIDKYIESGRAEPMKLLGLRVYPAP